MTFLPVAPFGGIAGWSFLERTRARQEEAFAQSPSVVRRTSQFEERIAGIASAEELVADRAVLEVALGAFGLDSDIGNRFFIRRVLEDGVNSPSALANRLADKRYLALAEAFGFGERPGGNLDRPGFAAEIVARYRERQFEVAAGQSNPDMRIALSLRRELQEIADRRLSNDGRWFTAMALPPVRVAFERALGLPKEVGAIDIDKQLSLFKERASQRLGTSEFTVLASSEGQERLLRAFLTSPETQAGSGAIRGAGALALLSLSARIPGR